MSSISKTVRNFSKLILLTFLLQFISQEKYGQCTIGDSIGTYDAASFSIGTRLKINDTISAGEYLTLLNIEAEFTYTIDVCADLANTYLTLFDESKSSIAFDSDDCGNDGRITFIAPVSGTYFVQLNLDGCATDNVEHDLYLKKDTSFCSQGIAHSSFNTAPLVANTRTLISSTIKAGQYVTLNNIVANTTYIVDACSDPANTSLTLRDTAGKSIKFSSYGCGNDGKITFTAPVSGAYKVSLNIDMCGTDAVNHSMYITRSSCVNPDSADISVVQAATCYGDTEILSFGGALNSATYWIVYKDSVGGEVIDSTMSNTFSFIPLQGTRTYYVRGERGCVYAADAYYESISITTDFKDASFSYNSSSYCIQDADTIPNIIGEAGGTFTAAPAGLALNASTGRIDNSASTPGTYAITYTTLGPCPASKSVDVTITSLDDVTFTYGATSFCKTDGDPLPTVSGVPGGVFSSSSVNLVVNSSNGIIDIGASAAGSYTITYTTSGNCANAGVHNITINDIDDGAFTYAVSDFCPNQVNPIPTITGLTGGSFSSTNGLVVDSSTGEIDVSASVPNNYNVFYTTNGSCPVISNFSIDLHTMDNANYDYGKTIFCELEASQLPTTYNTGTFTFTPTGLSINSTSGLLDASASTNGVYSLTYTTNGNCPNTEVKTITISAMDDAGFNYPAGNYCLSGTDPIATITGVTGGVFSSSPFGLAVNSTTGLIDLSASVPTNYLITYTTAGNCPNSATFPLTVSNLDNANFNYAKNNYCITSSDPTPTVTGISGGTFSSSPSGLSINSTSGLITIGLSGINTYDVTYTTSGNCPNSSTQSIILSSLDDASFNYGSSTYCAFSTDALPTITGLTSGVFSASPAGLIMQQNNGYINTGASNPGTYTITYTTAGDCMNSSSQDVTVISADDASFNYDAVEYCGADADPLPNIIGLNGGTYSSSPSGLDINPADGIIDLSQSIAEVYTVTYTTSGTCPNSSTQSIIILEASDAGFSYSSTNYCVSGVDPIPTITGLTGGIFSASPVGLVVNEYTGVIDVSASTAGTYNVTYSVGGDCPNTETQIVTIDNLDNADFSYSATNFCTAGSDPIPVISGVSGGDFTASPAGLMLYTANGEVDVSGSSIGDYTITYTTSGACPNSSSRSFELRNFDDASFNFPQSTYCVTDSDPSPVVTGLPGGSFAAVPSGMVINALSGKIDVSASTPGIYDVSYTTNGDCPYSNTQTLTIGAIDNSSFNFSASSYCVTDADPSPTIGGVSGGTFTSLPSGLDLDGTSGFITLNTSLPDTYVVTYTTNGSCPSSSTQSVTVNELDNAGFNFGQGSFCSSSANPFPTITGEFGGVFSASPTGITIDSSTGEIDIATSALNSYTITYATQGTCPNSSDVNVVLNAFDDASFAYSANSYCTSNPNPTPIITGVSGGAFSFSPSGLSFNAADGTIDLSNSLLGTYAITYATGGSCANATTQMIEVTDVDDASFSYGATHFCANDADAIVTISGVSGGVFNASPVGLVVDASTGMVDINSSSAGSYMVTYTTNGSCPTPNSKPFVLSSIPNINQSVQGCDSITLHGKKYFNSQIVVDTLSGMYCDSVVNTDLVINSANTGVDVVNAWCSHTWIDGNEYFNNNNTASYVLVNQGGCDSIVTLDLTVSSVDTVVDLYNSTFVSNASNATYQWVNCTQGYAPIPNATSKTFTPIQNGNYAVIVTEDNCTDTSACIFLTNVGVGNGLSDMNIDVYPNPFNEKVSIELERTSDVGVSIVNLAGELISEMLYQSIDKIQLDLGAFDRGVYFLTITSNNRQRIIKLIKQ